jgi:hypothetical protein
MSIVQILLSLNCRQSHRRLCPGVRGVFQHAYDAPTQNTHSLLLIQIQTLAKADMQAHRFSAPRRAAEEPPMEVLQWLQRE